MNTTSSRLSLWSPPIELSDSEEKFCARMKRTGRLYAFLRRNRDAIFDEALQLELLGMYKPGEIGGPPVPPAMLAMVTLLQAYEQRSDAGAVEQTVFDVRWQMVLDCHGAKDAAFSQGVLVDFRKRLIAADLDKRLIDRTVELAKESGQFGDKQLRLALDSAPLWGAGKVEDTFNLIGHAMEVVVRCVAVVLEVEPEQVRCDVGLELLGGSSLKAALDIDWDDPQQRHEALQRLLHEVNLLRLWVAAEMGEASKRPPVSEALTLLEKVVTQDLEPDPGGGGARIARGTVKDRRISINEPDMRHGRKSKSRLFNGYKRHVAIDMETGLILGVAARPANEPEADAAEQLRKDAEQHGPVAELNIDRGYLASDWVDRLDRAGVPVVVKPWPSGNRGLLPKSRFRIDLAQQRVTCPAGAAAEIRNSQAHFARATCAACPLRDTCTRARAGGRSITIHPKEELLIRLRDAAATPAGRRALRKRVAVEHRLAHLVRRQGMRARYVGLRKNVFDLRRTAAVENLNVIGGGWART